MFSKSTNKLKIVHYLLGEADMVNTRTRGDYNVCYKTSLVLVVSILSRWPEQSTRAKNLNNCIDIAVDPKYTVFS